MMRGRVADWFVALFVVSLIYVLVRPQSKGVELVDAVSRATTALVKTATDL
jgi:hypothetical protein